MRILIAYSIPETFIATLKAMGHTVVVNPNLISTTLKLGVKDCNPDIVVVHNTRVKQEAIVAGPRIKLIVRAGAGIDTIEAEMCNERGIFIADCPDLY